MTFEISTKSKIYSEDNAIIRSRPEFLNTKQNKTTLMEFIETKI